MKDIKCWCNSCGKEWYYEVDDEDFESGVEQGIYYGSDKTRWNAESCCDECMDSMRDSH